MSAAKVHQLPVERLTPEAFAPFGDVIELNGVSPASINQGFADRYNDLAKVDIAASNGAPCVAIFEARARPIPVEIRLMERHPLGTQIFYPLQDEPWLVLVCGDPLQ